MNWLAKFVLLLIIGSAIAGGLYVFRDQIFPPTEPQAPAETVAVPPLQPIVLPEIGSANDTANETAVSPEEQAQIEAEIEAIDAELTEKSPTPSVVEEPIAVAVEPEPSPEDDPRIVAAQKLFDENRFVEARQQMWDLMEKEQLTWESPLFLPAADIIGAVNTKALFSKLSVPEKVKVEVAVGDTLSGLAAKFNVPASTIQQMNGRKATNETVWAGAIYRILPGDWAVTVVKHRYLLIVYNQGKLFKVYPIAVGRGGKTPTGEFTIKTKEKEPEWTFEGRVIPYGDPAHELGSRWMGIVENDPNSDLSGYGIHGTNRPETIGTQASNGCVRMRNREVEELFDILTYGTPVRIIE